MDRANQSYKEWPWKNIGLTEQQVYQIAYWVGFRGGLTEARKELITDADREVMKLLIREAAELIRQENKEKNETSN